METMAPVARLRLWTADRPWFRHRGSGAAQHRAREQADPQAAHPW